MAYVQFPHSSPRFRKEIDFEDGEMDSITVNSLVSLKVEHFGAIRFFVHKITDYDTLHLRIFPNEFFEGGALDGWTINYQQGLFQEKDTGQELTFPQVFSSKLKWSSITVYVE